MLLVVWCLVLDAWWADRVYKKEEVYNGEHIHVYAFVYLRWDFFWWWANVDKSQWWYILCVVSSFSYCYSEKWHFTFFLWIFCSSSTNVLSRTLGPLSSLPSFCHFFFFRFFLFCLFAIYDANLRVNFWIFICCDFCWIKKKWF